MVKRLEAEKEDLLKELGSVVARKNAQLDVMRSVCNRLEYAQKEAVHFLSRPLERHDELEPVELGECVRFALRYLCNAHDAVHKTMDPVGPIEAPKSIEIKKTHVRSRSIYTTLEAPKCSKCSELTAQLATVASELDTEIALRERAETAKIVLETELEDLTAQLFTQANVMVKEEAELRDRLETSNRGLAQMLRTRESELRKTVASIERVQTQNVDGIEFRQFSDFLIALVKNVEVLSEPMMRRCMQEDIEPCLTPYGKSNVNVRKLAETMFLSEIPLHEDKGTQKCHLCGYSRECRRFIETKKGVKLYFDEFCQARVESVVDFYAWLRAQSSDKLGKRPILELYRVFLWHKRQMAQSRIGGSVLFKENTEKDAILPTNIQIKV